MIQSEIERIFNEVKQDDKELLTYKISDNAVIFIHSGPALPGTCLSSLIKITKKKNLSFIGIMYIANSNNFGMVFEATNIENR